MPRVVAVGSPHHITQRGNAQQEIFVSDSIRRVYLKLLADHAAASGLRLLAYCLMTNHVHLVAIPENESAMANAFRHAHARFAQYWNTEFARVGHLWQNRFYSCPVDEYAAWRVIRYVEQNPLRAGMVQRAGDYAWSSARAHSGVEPWPLMLDEGWWKSRFQASEWVECLQNGDPELPAIRKATYTGRPFGAAAFIRMLEERLGRKLASRKGGRPRISPPFVPPLTTRTGSPSPA